MFLPTGTPTKALAHIVLSLPPAPSRRTAGRSLLPAPLLVCRGGGGLWGRVFAQAATALPASQALYNATWPHLPPGGAAAFSPPQSGGRPMVCFPSHSAVQVRGCGFCAPRPGAALCLPLPSPRAWPLRGEAQTRLPNAEAGPAAARTGQRKGAAVTRRSAPRV